jgi:hypothetical protein
MCYDAVASCFNAYGKDVLTRDVLSRSYCSVGLHHLCISSVAINLSHLPRMEHAHNRRRYIHSVPFTQRRDCVGLGSVPAFVGLTHTGRRSERCFRLGLPPRVVLPTCSYEIVELRRKLFRRHHERIQSPHPFFGEMEDAEKVATRFT